MKTDPERTPFDEALKEHRKLKRLSRELRQFLDDPRPELGTGAASGWASSLCHHIVSLHESINRHFLVEEVGLLRELRSKHPAALPRLDESYREHAKILAGIKKLVADAMCYAEAERPAEPNLRRRARSLLEQIAGHEVKVTDLVQDLMLTDTGTGD